MGQCVDCTIFESKDEEINMDKQTKKKSYECKQIDIDCRSGAVSRTVYAIAPHDAKGVTVASSHSTRVKSAAIINGERNLGKNFITKSGNDCIIASGSA